MRDRIPEASRLVLAACAIGVMAGCAQARRSDEPRENTAVARASQSVQTCITVQRGVSGTVADTQIAPGDPSNPNSNANANYGGSATANSGASGGVARQALFRFDLAAVPAGSVVSSATVTLSIRLDQAATTVRVHRINSAWGELTVTWANFGAAFDAAVAASFVNGAQGYVGPAAFDATALAQAWVNDAQSNHGVLLEQDPVGLTNYWTSESPTVSQRPKLDLCYAAPSCTDGVQNQGEQGVDCGGPCPKECPHPPATQMVNAGETGRSTHFRAVYTLGQPTQNQDKSTSPSYRAQGGLIGANGSLP